MGCPYFVLKSYGSMLVLDDVGGIFSLFLMKAERRTLDVFFFLGWWDGNNNASALFLSLFRLFSSFFFSAAAFFSSFSRSVLRMLSSVNITANVVATVAGLRVEGGGVGTRGGGAKIDSTVSMTGGGEEEGGEEEGGESTSTSGTEGTGGARKRDESSCNPRNATPCL